LRFENQSCREQLTGPDWLFCRRPGRLHPVRQVPRLLDSFCRRGRRRAGHRVGQSVPGCSHFRHEKPEREAKRRRVVPVSRHRRLARRSVSLFLSQNPILVPPRATAVEKELAQDNPSQHAIATSREPKRFQGSVSSHRSRAIAGTAPALVSLRGASPRATRQSTACLHQHFLRALRAEKRAITRRLCQFFGNVT